MSNFLLLRERENVRALLKQLQKRPLTAFEARPMGMLLSVLRGEHHVEIIIDKWPEFTTFLIKVDRVKCKHFPTVMRCRIQLYSTDGEVLKQMLATPGVVPWHEQLTFAAIPENYVATVKEAIDKYGGPLQYTHGPFVTAYMDTIPPDLKPIPLLEGFKMRYLTPDDSDSINNLWEYNRGVYTEGRLRAAITHCLGACIENAEGEIVACGLTQLDGTFGIGWTHPQYRNNGFYQTIKYHILATALVKQRKPFVYSHHGVTNVISRHVADKRMRHLKGSIFFLEIGPKSHQDSKL